MIKLKYSMFELAIIQLSRERSDFTFNEVLDKMVEIRKFVDKKEKLVKKIIRPSKEEQRRQYYLKTGR